MKRTIGLVFPYVLNFFLIIISLPVHECAHGFVAYKLGDPTAKEQGRLSLNPMKHLSPIGMLMMLVTRVGFAKPVPINPNYFKNRKLGMAISSFAGPLSNIILALFFMILFRLFGGYTAAIFAFNYCSGESLFRVLFSDISALLSYCSLYFAMGNVGLAIFNLIPLPPLDGSRIVTLFLPEKYYFNIMRYERYIMIVIFVLVYLGVFSRPLMQIESFIINLFLKIVLFNI